MMSTRSRPSSRLETLKLVIALPLAALMVPLPVVAQMAPVVAPDSGNTRVYVTASGTAVQEIATANGAGLSHNKFTSYDVGPGGLVINNAAPNDFTVSSELAGTITTNFNLKESATVILNEVVAPNASTIAGFTEIVGGKADLIVANPYGIAVKGGGFINTDRVTLATATPQFGANGALTGLKVTGGELAIAGSGLNASNVNLLTLLARSIKVDGQVNGRDVLLAAGANDFDYGAGTVTPNGHSAGDAPAYAIDSSALGGMYANRIRLLATDVGVGVRMLGDAAATAEDLAIDAAGKVQLASKVYAERDVKVTAASAEISGSATSVTAKNDITVTAEDTLTLTDGALVAGRDLTLSAASLTDSSAAVPTSANRFAIGNVAVKTTGTASVTGSAYGAGGALRWESGATQASGLAGFYSGADAAASDRSLSLVATTGDLNLGNAQLVAPAAVTLAARTGNVITGPSGAGTGLQVGSDLAITAGAGTTLAGNITTAGKLALTAGTSVANSGTIIAGDALTVGSGGGTPIAFTNDATGVVGARSVSITAATVSNAGAIQGTEAVTVAAAGQVTNAADAMILTAGEAGRDVTLTAGSLENRGYVQSTGALKATIAGATVNHGVIATQAADQGGANGALTLATRSVENSGTLQSGGTLQANLSGTDGVTFSNSGRVQALGDITLNAGPRVDQAATGSILSNGAIALQSGAGTALTLNNAGRIQAADTLAIGAAAASVVLTQAAGAVTMAGRSAEVVASSISNAGLLQAGDALNVRVSGDVSNEATGAFLTTGSPGKDLVLTANAVTNAGQIQSTGAVNLSTARAVVNSGNIVTLDAAGGGAAGNVGMAVESLTNSGTVQSAGALTVTTTLASGTSLTNSGKLLAQAALALQTGSAAIENSRGGLIVTNDGLTLAASALTNAGTIQAARDLTATIAGTLENTADGLLLTIGSTPGAVTLRTGTLVNAGTLQSSGAFDGTGRAITNHGSILSQDVLSLASGSTLLNSGVIQAARSIALVTPEGLTNTATGKVVGGTDVVLSSGAGEWTLNNAGRIQAGEGLTIASASARAAVDNLATGILFAGAELAGYATSLENAGIGRGTTHATFDVAGDLDNRGVLATAGRAGAQVEIDAGTLTNSGQIQSVGALRAVVGGAVLNTSTGVLFTADGGNGGSGGDIFSQSSTFTNHGAVQSAGSIELVALASGVTSFTNTGRVQAANAIDLTAPTEQLNTGVILAGGSASLQGAGSAFGLNNTGTIQAGGELSIGASDGRVALDNSGSAISGSIGAVVASTVQNSGGLHAGSHLEVNATGGVINSGTAQSSGTLNLDAATLANAGTIESTQRLDSTTSGITANTGVIASTNGSGAIRASDLTNSANATISAGNNLNLTTVGAGSTTLSNSGTIQSGGNLAVTARNGITNAATGVMNGGGNVTLTSGGNGFTLTNDGKVQSGSNLSIGTADDRVTLDNRAGALIRAGGSVTALATTIANAGTIQGATGVSLDLTGALTQTGSGSVVTTGGAGADIAITAASISNAGRIHSTGGITAATTGAIDNTTTGTWLTTGTGAISTNSSTLANQGVIESGGSLAVSVATDLINHTGARLQSGADLTLTTPRTLDNQGDVISGGNIVLLGGSTAFDVINNGGVQAAQNVTFGTNSVRANVSNSAVGAPESAGLLTKGMIQAGGAINGFATNFVNAGHVQAASGMTLDASGALTNQAAARLFTDGSTAGNVTLTAATLNNAGTLQSSGTLTATTSGNTDNTGLVLSVDALTATAAALTNSGTVQSGGALATHLVQLTNTGTMQSTGAMQLNASSSLQNDAAAKILTTGAPGASLTINTGTLTNAGAIQSAGALTATTTSGLTNSGTLLTVADTEGGSNGAVSLTVAGSVLNSGAITSAGTLGATAGSTFTNSGTIKTTGAANLITGTTFSNTSGAKIAGADSVTVNGASAFALSNAGLIQAGTSLQVGDAARRAAITNSGGASLQAGGDIHLQISGLTNSGVVQAGGNATVGLAPGATLTNNATGKLMSGDAMTLDSSSGGFTLNNAGLVQAGGLLTIGGAGRAATINQTTTTAKLFADTYAITAAAVTNQGMIMGNEGGTFTAVSFLNSGSGSRFIAATGSGATTVNVSGGLTNEGAIHSNGALTINAASITNTSTGGLSSLANLTLQATAGDIHNQANGALYSGATMTLTAADDIINDTDATIDTDGDFNANAVNLGSEFTNRGQINVGGNATINARTFQNVMAGAENLVREWNQPSTINQHNYIAGVSGDPAPNVDTSKWYFTHHGGYSGSWFDDRESPVYGYYYNKQEFVGIDDAEAMFGGKTMPQISAANLSISGFDSGKNVGGMLTATGTLAITGRTGGSSFTNDAMALEIEKWNYQATWWYEYTLGDYDWWNPTGGNYITNVLKTIAYANQYFTVGSGLRAGHLTVSNVGTLSLLGSALAPLVNSTSATGGTMSSLDGAANVSGASSVGGASATALTGASLTGPGQATTIGGASASGWFSAARARAAGGVSANQANLDSSGSSTGHEAGKSAALFGAAGRLGAAQGNAFANAMKNAKVSLGGLNLALPSNPNGYFVTSADPKAKYVVSVNDTFGIDPSSAVGSDLLLEKLGVDPERQVQRLGDPAYETYLVRQQLADQLGTKFLAGQKSEAQQMEMLMNNAAAEAARLGFQFGQAPTAAQLAALDRDIVWMVEQVVGGQRVLVPQVYLSAKTKSLFDAGGSTLAGDEVELDVGSLTNEGGSISGSDTLSIKAKNDITNRSGSITGGDVSLTAGGSITNETLTRGNEDSNVIGKTATIGASGDLALDAGKDIKIIGGDVKAGGDAEIAAGGDIVVDTVQKKTTTRTESHDAGFASSSKTVTTVSEVKHQGSNLDFGGNLKIKSGGDTTLAGSDLNVGGNLDTDVKGDLNVLARQDQRTVDTSSSNSGFGVGGGLYGTQTTTTNDFTGTNKGSNINVGGNANLNTGNTLTIEGSNLNIGGSATLSAQDVQILDGKDERRTTTRTETTTIGAFADGGAKGEADASANVNGYSASAGAKGSASSSGGASGSAQAGTRNGPAHSGSSAEANAKGSASGDLTIGIRTQTTTTTDYSSKSVGSQLNIGGNLTINAKNDVTLRGSSANAQGDVNVNATNINLLAGQDVTTHSSSSRTETAGVYVGGSTEGEASAQMGSGPTGGYGGANASGEAEVSAGLQHRTNTTTENSGSTTARTSSLGGNNVNLNARNKITEEGAKLNAENDLSMSAKSLESRAAANTSWSDSSSNTNTSRIGAYADAEGKASLGGTDGAQAGGSVSAGVKVQHQRESSSESSQSSTAVTSSYGGKNVKITTTDNTSLEGTTINANGGAVDITAGSLDYKAAKNTSSSSSSSSSLDASLKLGVGAGAEAGQEDTGAGVGVTGKAKVGLEGSSSNSSNSQSVVGSIGGGTINIKTTKGDTNLEGTNLKSTGSTTIDSAGDVNFTAARDTSSSNSTNYNGEIKAEFGQVNNEVGLKGGYGDESKNSDRAVTGTIESGGGITIKAKGDATIEGANLDSQGDTTLAAGGNVNLKQATSTESSSGGSIKGDATLGDSGVSAKVSGGYESSDSKKADTVDINARGNLNISSGKDTNIQGGTLSAGGTANVNAGGQLNVTAKEESSSSFNVSGGVGVGKAGVGGNVQLGGEASQTQQGATISGGSGVNLTSGAAGTNLQGTQVKSQSGDVNVKSQGAVKTSAAVSTSIGGSFGVAAGAGTTTGVTQAGVSGDVGVQSTKVQAGGQVKVQSNAPAPQKK